MVGMMTVVSVSLLASSFAFGLAGAFYLSAQALGFDNLKKVAKGLSELATLVGPIELRVVDSDADNGTTATKAWTIQSLVTEVLRLWFHLISAFVFHSVLGIILVIVWLVATEVFSINVSVIIRVTIAIALYVLGSWAFGERPHDALKWLANAPLIPLRSHLEWVENNTRDGGRTGLLGFSFLALGLFLQLAGSLSALQR